MLRPDRADPPLQRSEPRSVKQASHPGASDPHTDTMPRLSDEEHREVQEAAQRVYITLSETEHQVSFLIFLYLSTTPCH